jgi:hypothetical protein
VRLPHPDNPRLEALLGERDHVRVQISLLHDNEKPDRGRLKTLERRLASLQMLIDSRK